MCMSENFKLAHKRYCRDRDAGFYEPNHHGNKARSASVYIEEISCLQLRACVLFLHLFYVIRVNSFISVALGGIIGFERDFNL